ncbi:MAG: hypothetical protein FWD47_14445 [Treponema sp.]|nr:hypothetical protein [Treponema sp.]
MKYFNFITFFLLLIIFSCNKYDVYDTYYFENDIGVAATSGAVGTVKENIILKIYKTSNINRINISVEFSDIFLTKINTTKIETTAKLKNGLYEFNYNDNKGNDANGNILINNDDTIILSLNGYNNTFTYFLEKNIID